MPVAIAPISTLEWAAVKRKDGGMRYLVTARVKPGRRAALGRGSVAGGEYQHNMAQARQQPDGRVQWIETCFCAVPLDEERPYWEAYFELEQIKDAHDRRQCRHENGEQAWACSTCDCTTKLDVWLQRQGRPFRVRR